jgi:hypothetical protein
VTCHPFAFASCCFAHSLLVNPDKGPIIREGPSGASSPILPQSKLRRGLDSDIVVYGRSNSLRAAEVSLRRLHRHMPEEELDLLKFAASGAAESGTASAQVVRRELADPCLFRELLNDVPSKFLGHPASPSLASTAHTTEHLSRPESRRFDPRGEFAIDPVWHRHRPDVAPLAAEVYDRPMSFPLLKVTDSQLGDFVPPQPTREQEG